MAGDKTTRDDTRPQETTRDETGRDGTSRAGVRAADGVRTSRHATSRLASAAGSTRRAPATSATPRDDCVSSTSRGCMSSAGCGAGSGSSIGAGARSARGAGGGPGAAALAWRGRYSADATDATAADASAPNFCFLPNSCQNPANCGLVCGRCNQGIRTLSTVWCSARAQTGALPRSAGTARPPRPPRTAPPCSCSLPIRECLESPDSAVGTAPSGLSERARALHGRPPPRRRTAAAACPAAHHRLAAAAARPHGAGAHHPTVVR